MINFEKNVLDTAKMKVLKGSRGVGFFVEQREIMSHDSTEETLLFANKVLTHEEAIELRDYLIGQYPLENPEKMD